jgi:hypothetical protein
MDEDFVNQGTCLQITFSEGLGLGVGVGVLLIELRFFLDK